jgi:uncharacterized protein (UPF0276 family)
MKFFEAGEGRTQIGLAYGPGFEEFIASNTGLIDYVEIPFEQLRHTPHLGVIQEQLPVVLHCASLSVAGFIPPSQTTVDALVDQAARTRTPWIGEHLAFVSADGITEEPDRDLTPTNLTYTLCPQLSGETVQRVVENMTSFKEIFQIPLILENSPQYFPVPGSTMNMVDFVAEVASQTDTGLLLDLSHFAITSLNTKVDAVKEIDRLPLERVVEIHISGYNEQEGVVWDDHAAPAPPLVFELLERVAARAQPKALTLEYNWLTFPATLLLSHIERTQNLLERV